MNYLIKILLVLSVALVFSCGDVAKDIEKDGDFVEMNNDSNVSKFDTSFTYVRAKGLKGAFKSNGLASYENIDTIIDFKIGEYSTAELTLFEVDSGQVLPKKVSGDYIKVEFSGDSYNEFTDYELSWKKDYPKFSNMTLTAYSKEADTVDLVLNVVNHFISSLYESGAEFEESKNKVLADLLLDSNFEVNTDWDSEDANPVYSGAILAISGLTMRMLDDGYETEDWDVMPYENSVDSLYEFKHWATYIDSSFIIKGQMEPNPTLDTAVDYNTDLAKYENICNIAYKNVNENINELRNLVLYGVSEESRDECKKYIKKVYIKNVPLSEKWLY